MQELEQLYADYNRDIYHFLFKISGYDSFLAEELTQETFYQAFTSIAKFQGRCQIKTWLCQIAKNIYYQYLRKKKKEHITIENARKESEIRSITSLEKKIENAELIQNALAIVNTFDNRTRDILIYRLYSDLPYSQISLLLGISEGSAKVIFFRGKTLLQSKLREDLGYEISL